MPNLFAFEVINTAKWWSLEIFLSHKSDDGIYGMTKTHTIQSNRHESTGAKYIDGILQKIKWYCIRMVRDGAQKRNNNDRPSNTRDRLTNMFFWISHSQNFSLSLFLLRSVACYFSAAYCFFFPCIATKCSHFVRAFFFFFFFCCCWINPTMATMPAANHFCSQ